MPLLIKWRNDLDDVIRNRSSDYHERRSTTASSLCVPGQSILVQSVGVQGVRVRSLLVQDPGAPWMSCCPQASSASQCFSAVLAVRRPHTATASLSLEKGCGHGARPFRWLASCAPLKVTILASRARLQSQATQQKLSQCDPS